MSRIVGPLARRLDRLAWRAHRFHRFAHHPLCAAYQGEVYRWRRYWFCRGCTLAAGGALLGILGGLGLPVLRPRLLGLVFAVALLGGWAAIRRGGFRRGRKWVTRLLPAALAGFLVFQALRNPGLGGAMLAMGVGLGLGAAVTMYRRRGPWREPCRNCAERAAAPCSGFRSHFQRERAFQRLAGYDLRRAELGDPSQGDMMRPTST